MVLGPLDSHKQKNKFEPPQLGNSFSQVSHQEHKQKKKKRQVELHQNLKLSCSKRYHQGHIKIKYEMSAE